MLDNSMDGVKIPDSLLESIAGGVLDAETEAEVYSILVRMKKLGMGKEVALVAFSQYEDPQVAADCIAYVEENWDLVPSA